MDVASFERARKTRGASPEPLALSHSSLTTWAECRKRFELRHILRLEPQHWPQESEALQYGRLFDRALTLLHSESDEGRALEWLDAQTLARQAEPQFMDRYVRARAMLRAYFERYRARGDEWRFVGLQCSFEGPIVNPLTGAAAKLATFCGIVDGLVLDREGRLWIYELKTASRLDGGYIEGLWTAPQTGLYALYVGRVLGIAVHGVIYDLCQKAPAQTKRHEGETEAGYEARAAALRAANKSGKTSAKRQQEESLEGFEERLFEWHGRPEAFHREAILIDRGRLEDVAAELWSKTQDVITSRRNGLFYRNDRACRAWGSECEYLALCETRQNPVVLENLYRTKEGAQSAGQQAGQDTASEVF